MIVHGKQGQVKTGLKRAALSKCCKTGAVIHGSQVSTDGGTQPRWNRNGRELFYRSGAKMIAVDTELAPTFRAGTPKMLFEMVSPDYDVHPDGKRFLMLKPAATTADNSELHIILNWFDDLRKKVPLEK